MVTMPITIEQLAIHRGMKTAEDGSYSGADIAAVGLAILGGCCRCAATIAAYNAYPSKNGYWMCGDCIEGEGEESYATVEEANAAIFGEAEPKPSIRVFTDRELATVLHALRILQEQDDTPESEAEEIDELCERLNLGPEKPKETPTEFELQQLDTLRALCGCGAPLYGIIRVHHCDKAVQH